MSAYVTVYTPGFKSVLNLPQKSVFHIPEGPNSRLVLCANFDAASPAHSCNMGDACRFVHADVSAAREHNIHVNYAWRSIEEVSYERFPAGQVLRVAPPNSKIASDVMDSDMVLKTRALTSHRRPLSHCAHYYFNRTCNLGSDCHFVHAVYVDPTAVPGQRAPVPSQMGDGREAQLSKRQREAAAAASSVAATPRRAPFVTHATPQQQRFAAAAAPVAPKAVAAPVAPASAPAVAVVATPVSTPKAAPQAVEESAKPTAAAAARLPRSPSSSSCPSESSTSTHRHSYRYDPYSKTQPMLVLCCA